MHSVVLKFRKGYPFEYPPDEVLSNFTRVSSECKKGYKQLVIRWKSISEFVRFRVVMTGMVFILLAIPSYAIVPSLITGVMNKFSGGSSPSPMASQIFSQLGIPPIDTIIKIVQYSLIGLIVVGLFITTFGVMVKKMPKQHAVTLSIDSSQNKSEQENANLKALYLLQERLAKGEITSRQYQSLKNVLEDKV